MKFVKKGYPSEGLTARKNHVVYEIRPIGSTGMASDDQRFKVLMTKTETGLYDTQLHSGKIFLSPGEAMAYCEQLALGKINWQQDVEHHKAFRAKQEEADRTAETEAAESFCSLLTESSLTVDCFLDLYEKFGSLHSSVQAAVYRRKRH